MPKSNPHPFNFTLILSLTPTLSPLLSLSPSLMPDTHARDISTGSYDSNPHSSTTRTLTQHHTALVSISYHTGLGLGFRVRGEFIPNPPTHQPNNPPTHQATIPLVSRVFEMCGMHLFRRQQGVLGRQHRLHHRQCS